MVVAVSPDWIIRVCRGFAKHRVQVCCRSSAGTLAGTCASVASVGSDQVAATGAHGQGHHRGPVSTNSAVVFRSRYIHSPVPSVASIYSVYSIYSI